MSIITSVGPNGTVSGPLPNTPQQALAPASAMTGAAQAARPLIPGAVIGNTLVPTYQESRTPKTTLRSSNGPSSQLAAQYLGQLPDADDDTLAIFERRDQPQQQQSQQQDNTPPEDDFLAALRTARGDTPQVPANNNTPVASPVTQTAAASNPNAISNILNFSTAATSTQAKLLGTTESRALPALAQTAAGKKPGLAQTRGASAYQLAAARNESNIISAGVDAIL